jgi:hypothetical protein
MEVFDKHTQNYGTCNINDYHDAKQGINPSRMVPVTFERIDGSFYTRAIPIVYLRPIVLSELELQD